MPHPVLSSAVQPLSAPLSSKVGLGVQSWKNARSEPRTPFPTLPGLATPQETSRCVFPVPCTGPLPEEEARLSKKASPKGPLSNNVRRHAIKGQIPEELLLSVEKTKGTHFCELEVEIRV